MPTATVYMNQGGDEMTVADGGAITIEAGGSLALGASITLSITGANIVLTGIPTSDPGVAGALWANTNVLTLSAG